MLIVLSIANIAYMQKEVQVNAPAKPLSKGSSYLFYASQFLKTNQLINI